MTEIAFTDWFTLVCGVGVAIVGGLGLILAVVFMVQDAKQEQQEQVIERRDRIAAIRWARSIAARHGRIIGGTAIAVILASAKMLADDPNGACTEATLRVLCGDLWYVCYYTLGCYMLPG